MKSFYKIIVLVCFSYGTCFCQTDNNISELIGALYDSDWRERCVAARELGSLGEDAVTASAELLDLLEENERLVRYSAVKALGQIKDSATIETLVNVLREEEDEYIQKAIVEALGNMEEKADIAIPAICEFFAKKCEMYGENSRNRLEGGYIHRGHKKVFIDTLCKIANRSPLVISQIAEVLDNNGKFASIDGFAKDCIFWKLCELNHDKDASWLGNQLREILYQKYYEVIPVLISALQNGKDYVKANAAIFVEMIGEEAESTVSALLVALESSENEILHYEVIKALGAIGTKAKQAVPDIFPFMDSPNYDVKIEVIQALLKIAPETPETLTFIKQIESTPEQMLGTRIHFARKSATKLNLLLAHLSRFC